MTGVNCVSGPGEEARVSVRQRETAVEREITLPLCEACARSFDEMAGIAVSRTQSADERIPD